MIPNLRELLDETVSDLEKHPLETHSERLREIASITPHSIVVLDSTEPIGRFNCVMHALGLVGRMAEYPHPLWVAKTAFVSYLIGKEVLKGCEAQPGALVAWSTSEGLKHLGRLVEPYRAESKWGLGILCQHALKELPIRYGDRSGFYTPPTPETVLEHLEEWCTRSPAS
jgi:hypothetical protein